MHEGLSLLELQVVLWRHHGVRFHVGMLDKWQDLNRLAPTIARIIAQEPTRGCAFTYVEDMRSAFPAGPLSAIGAVPVHFVAIGRTPGGSVARTRLLAGILTDHMRALGLVYSFSGDVRDPIYIWPRKSLN